MHTKEDILYRTILIVALVIGTIILGFVLSVIRQQRRFRRLNLRRIEIEIDTLEKERKRMAADLHDGLGADLSALKFKLESLHLSSDFEQLQLAQCIGLINDLISRIRGISNGLMPQTLIHRGIVYALNEYINKINGDSHLEIIFEFRNIPEIPPSRSIHIFRILQEIIHNTLKHAQADTLKIKLFIEKDKLIILTADDGVGFNYPGDIKNNKGLGLQNLENRANLLNGALHIHSVKGSGARYHISLPL